MSMLAPSYKCHQDGRRIKVVAQPSNLRWKRAIIEERRRVPRSLLFIAFVTMVAVRHNPKQPTSISLDWYRLLL